MIIMFLLVTEEHFWMAWWQISYDLYW